MTYLIANKLFSELIVLTSKKCTFLKDRVYFLKFEFNFNFSVKQHSKFIWHLKINLTAVKYYNSLGRYTEKVIFRHNGKSVIPQGKELIKWSYQIYLFKTFGAYLVFSLFSDAEIS